MSSVSGWYDPICYQFFFYACSDIETEPSIIDACGEFFDEMIPYYALWLSMEGRVLGRYWTEFGCRVTTISNVEALENYADSISAEKIRSLELSLVPGKAFANFAVPGRSIPKAWKNQVMHFTDLRKLEAIDKASQKEWLHALMNCPTDDLRGMYFPKKCLMPKDMLLKITYESFCSLGTAAYVNEILKDIGFSATHSDEQQPLYIHRMHVSIPRFMLDAMNQTFELQSAWKKRLTTLCESFENSVGYMKMDACEMNHSARLLTGSGSLIPGFSQYLPDVAWAMCLTLRQAESLGGLDYLMGNQVFHDIVALGNHKLYLQLTPDISVVTSSDAAKLWKITSPHLQFLQHSFHSIAEVPVSFRMGVDTDQLQVDDYGCYRMGI